jgi:hypothetical protein
VGAADALAPSPPYSRLSQFVPALAIGLCAGLLPLIGPATVVWIALAALCFAPFVWYGFCKPKLWPLLFCGAAILFPPLPFPVGDSGVHVSIVIAGAGLLAGLARLQEWRIERNGLNLALIALVGALAVSLGFAALYSGFALASASAARLALFAFGVYVYFTASQGPGVAGQFQAERSARWLFGMAVAAALFGCVDFVYQLPAPAGFGAQFIWLGSGVYRRAQGLFYDASALGNFCAFFLVMSVVALAHRGRGAKILSTSVASFGAVLFLMTLLLSFSRAPLLAAIIGCVALAALEKDRWARSRWTSPRMLLALAALVVMAVTGHGPVGKARKLADHRRLYTRTSVAGARGHRLQDAALLRPLWKTGDRRQHVPVRAGGNRGIRSMFAGRRERGDFGGGLSRRQARIVLRKVDLLFLGRRNVPDVRRRHSNVLACPADVLLGAGAGGAGSGET